MILKRFLIFLIFLCSAYNLMVAQNDRMTSLINDLAHIDVELLLPVEKKIEVFQEKNSDAQENFRMRLGDREVWFYIYPANDKKIQFPHLEFNRLNLHLSSNGNGSNLDSREDVNNIYIYKVPLEPGLDWMGEARFTPKRVFSAYDYATTQAFFKEGKGMVVLVFLDKKLEASFPRIIKIN